MAERSEAVEEQAVRDASAAYKVAADIATTEDVPPGYKRTEAGVIPEDWRPFRIGEVSIKVGSGITPTGGSRVYKSSGRPFVRSQNVAWGYLDLNDIAYIDEATHANFAGTEIEGGDVLLNITGASIGRAAIADYRLVGGNVNQHVCIIRPRKDALEPEFLAAFIISSDGQNQIDSFQAGGNRQGLNFHHVRSIRLAIPGVEEQRAIATALSDANALIESLDRLIAKKRAIKQAAMQQLLTGQTRLPGFTGDWETKRLGEVAEIRSGGTPSTAMPAFWNGGVPWCTPTDITALGGRKYLSETERTISHAGLRASSAENIPPQSIIMTTRATIGECAINAVPMTTNQGFKNLVPFSANTEFLYYLMTTKKGELIQLCGGSTFLEIGKKQLNSFEIKLPRSREEQEVIATLLSNMDTELEALERRRDKVRQIKQGMMQQLLTGRVRLVVPRTTEPVAC